MKRQITKLSIFILIITALVLSFSACDKNTINENTVPNEKEFESIASCARDLKNRMKDPESFSVYGTCYYYEEGDGGVIVIPYRGTNSFGGYLTDIAYYAYVYRQPKYYGSESDYTSGKYTNFSAVDKTLFLQIREFRISGNYSKSYDAETVMKGL